MDQGHHLGLGIIRFADARIECVGNVGDVSAVVARARRPLAGKLIVSGGTFERLLPAGQHSPFLNFAGALGDRIVDRFACVHQQVLEMSFDAGCDVGKAFARFALASSAKTGEIILAWRYVTGKRQVAGLEEHLKESHVPADAEFFANPHVVRGD